MDVVLNGSTVTLNLLSDDLDLELYAAERRADLFRKVFDRELIFEVRKAAGAGPDESAPQAPREPQRDAGPLAERLRSRARKSPQAPSRGRGDHDARVAARRLLAAGELWASHVSRLAGVRDRLPRIPERLGRLETWISPRAAPAGWTKADSRRPEGSLGTICGSPEEGAGPGGGVAFPAEDDRLQQAPDVEGGPGSPAEAGAGRAVALDLAPISPASSACSPAADWASSSEEATRSAARCAGSGTPTRRWNGPTSRRTSRAS